MGSMGILDAQVDLRIEKLVWSRSDESRTEWIKLITTI